MMDGSMAPVQFYAQQAKVRRQTWQVTAIAMVVAGALGLIASAGLGPLLLVLFAVIVRFADILTLGLLAPVRGGLSSFVGLAFADLGAVIDQLDKPGTSLIQSIVALWRFAVLIPLGVGLTLAAHWWLLRHVSRLADDAMVGRLKTHAAVRSLGGEADCLRLAEELSINAGIAAPRVLVVDHDGANVGIVGTDHRDWTLLVTKGFAEQLDKVAKRGAIAGAVARVVDGDLDVNASVSALGSTVGLLRTVLDWPISASARARTKLLMANLTGRVHEPAELERRLSLAGTERGVEIDKFDKGKVTYLQQVLGWLRAPFHIVSFGFLMFAGLFSGVLVGLTIGWLLRRRVFQADAAAAKLIGDPDAVAAGVTAVARAGSVPAGALPWSHFFMVPHHDIPRGKNIEEHAALMRMHMARSRKQEHDELGLAQSSVPAGAERVRQLIKLGARPASQSAVASAMPNWLWAVVVALLSVAALGIAFLIAVFTSFFVVSTALIGYGLAYVIL